jgi:hypothetical protein
VSDATRWLSWSDLQHLLDPDTLRRLWPLLTHTGIDGQPCVEQDRIDDVLRLLEEEGTQS